MADDLDAALQNAAADINAALDRLIPVSDDIEGRLHQAMRYSSLDGGKRLRPFLVLSGAEMFGVASLAAVRAAAAVEMVHCYSLIHDDLPSMDNDDLRRGRPTCHKRFDEPTAILAGDALLTKAFEILADPTTHYDPAVRSELVLELARAAGDHGMVAGQMIDLCAHETEMDLDEIIRLQHLKTGRLFGFACEAGAILAKSSSRARLALRAYAHDLGLAFQIADDLLDIEGDSAALGKAVGKDQDAGKATLVSVMGIDRARAQARILADQAIAHLEIFGDKANLLRSVADFVVNRRS